MLRTPLACLVLLVPGLAQGAVSSKLDVPALLREVIHNQRRMDGRVVDYTSTVHITTKWFDGKNRTKSIQTDVYEHYPAYPNSVTILVESNGSPLPADKIEKQRAKALVAMERSQARLIQTHPDREAENRPGFRFFLGVYPFLRNTEIYATGKETLDAREMIVLYFRPKPGWVDPDGIVHQLAGMLWIDTQDRIVAQAKAWPAGQTPANGVFFEMRHAKVFPDAWALVSYRLNPAVKPELFKQERFDWSLESSAFKRFIVEPEKIERMGS